MPDAMKTQVQVKDLQSGDVLSSGAEILGRPTISAEGPKKCLVPVKYPGGRTKDQSWGKYTTVTVVNR